MTRSAQRVLRAALLTFLTLVTVGCTPSTSITRDEAEERLEEHATAAADALPDKLELDPFGGVSTPPCDSSENRIRVSEFYWLDGMPEDNKANVETLVQHWQANGYEITRDERPDSLLIAVEHGEDGFKLNVKTSIQGDLSLYVSSPCIWPEGSRWTWGD